MITILILLVLMLVILTSWMIFIKDCNKFNFSGPRPLPLIGNGFLLLTKSRGFLPLLHRLREEYGDVFRAHLLHTVYVVLSHPKYIEDLMSSNELITKGYSYYFLKPWLGDGLLTSTGHRWRTMRKFLTPAFHFKILQNFLPVFLKNEKILIKKLQNYIDGKAFDVFPIIALTALDNVTESIMGVSFDAQNNSESKYVKAIESLSKILSLRMRNPFVGEDPIFNLLPYKKVQDEATEILHSHTRKVINLRRDELQKSNINISILSENFDLGIKNKHAFLDLLLLSEIDGKQIGDEHVREEVDTFMFEGHDTTTSGICFALYCLSKHPEVQEKILEEQKSIIGANLNRDPTYAEVQQMKYLELVIKESLRIYPSVPLIERLVTKDTEIAGLKIRKNASVIVNIFEMHRHPDIYDNPMEFRPERFEATSASMAKNAFSWLAFSAGPRNCIGQKFAMMEMKVTIAGIIKHFILLPEYKQDIGLCAELILRSDTGVKLKLKPRDKKH
ncbi:cytochrome P450 4d2-like isoform X1 [Nymphalis io]|uniref:cytochrome P450 4d2-like isoform X1 n=1 Tax=Inachis io TaxID=171585 RepID=UPI0021676D52|nr:cytochrome P450 4d2-like isoform X1 [Nymphalis io]